jgi:heme-degrading monooxygenase HmoA
MFVVIIRFPPIKTGRDAEFREWFAWSSREFAKHEGFIGRRLLRPVDGGTYVAIMEHESRETFAAVQYTPEHDQAAKRIVPLLDGRPVMESYEVAVG